MSLRPRLSQVIRLISGMLPLGIDQYVIHEVGETDASLLGKCGIHDLLQPGGVASAVPEEKRETVFALAVLEQTAIELEYIRDILV